MTPRAIRIPLLLASIGLAACQTEFEADLAADPLDDAERVTLALDGVELERSDGTTVEFERNETGEPNMLLFDGDQTYEVVTDNDADDGDFTGIRLLFARNGSEYVAEDDPTEIEIETPDNPPFVDVDLEVKKDERTTVLMAIDLRLSLTVDQDDEDATLSPVMRAVRAEDEADVAGRVGSSLRNDSACTGGGAAVYAFEGHDVEPDERNAEDAEPFATAPVSSSDGFYHLILLPAGEYTLAFTCDGDHENGLLEADNDGDGVRFADETENVTLDEGESERQDF
ncbi:MAG TPA: DUF4382 domain-containing protein [Nevskiaceae bacterium]|nr:DUF4382 domain-containing protein [Nevskiaceae bacterium]